MKFSALTIRQFQNYFNGRLNRFFPIIHYSSGLEIRSLRNSLVWNKSQHTQFTLPNNAKCIHHSVTAQLHQTFILSNESAEIREYEYISNETLELLTEKLEELIEQEEAPPDSDITYSSGVLTLKLGSHGTYVINKQSPNKQIWLSSPFSGPKRFDFQHNEWIYRHDGSSLHNILSEELSAIFKKKIELKQFVDTERRS